MTVFRQEELTCAVCGHTDLHTVLASTSAVGSPDLDSRPPPLERVALPMQIQRCPSCGYCARDVTHASPAATAAVERPEYQRQLQDATSPSLANMFLCESMILEAQGDHAAAGWAAMRAAWACDDAGESYRDVAVRCRLRAVSLFERVRGQVLDAKPGSEEVIIADLLRRAGRFAEGSTTAEEGLASRPDEATRAMLLFQRHLCRLGDDGPHTVEEAQQWAAEHT